MAAFRSPVCFMNFWADSLPTSLLYISILLSPALGGRPCRRPPRPGLDLCGVEGTQRTAGGGSGGSDQLRDTLSRPGVFGRGTFSNTFHGRRESGCLKRFITVCTTTTPERAGKFTCIHADLYTPLYTRRGPSESADELRNSENRRHYRTTLYYYNTRKGR